MTFREELEAIAVEEKPARALPEKIATVCPDCNVYLSGGCCDVQKCGITGQPVTIMASCPRCYW